jgi:hypothetical protein
MESTILIAAKQEYTEQLNDILSENLLNTVKDMWVRCKHTRNPLRKFQEDLCSIPEWNRQVLLKYYNNIIEKGDISEEYLEKIIEAVFVSNIKILSVVKLENKKQTVNIKIPDTKDFIHKCIIQLARELYQDPHLIDDRESSINLNFEIQRNNKRMIKITKECIEKTIRNTIPMKDILDKYLEAQDDSRSLSSNENIEFEQPQPQPESEPQPIQQDPQPQVPPQPEQFQPPSQEQQPQQEPPNVDSIFMEAPPEEPIKVSLPSSNAPRQNNENFFSDEED